MSLESLARPGPGMRARGTVVVLPGAAASCPLTADREPSMRGEILRRIRREDWRTMPWKNGGGITHELWREGAGKEGWALRLSLAEVRQDGPFSRFEGIDRVILLLEGEGFCLARPDGVEVRIQEVARPFCFLGEDPWNCTLLGGPTLDLNVMVERKQGTVAVWRQEPGIVAARWFFCLEAGTVNGEPVTTMELLCCDGPVECSGRGIAIQVSEFA